MGTVRKYKPKQENVNKLKQYLAYITKTKKSNLRKKWNILG